MRGEKREFNRRRLLTNLLPLAVSMILLALIGCEYFTDVTANCNESNKPVPVGRLFQYSTSSGDNEFWGFGAGDIEITTNDINDYFIAIGAAVDGGGMKELEMHHLYTTICERPGFSDHYAYDYQPVLTKSSSASCGATVSNGMYHPVYVSFGGHTSCPSSYTLKRVTYSWSVWAHDFSWNSEGYALGKITYEP